MTKLTLAAITAFLAAAGSANAGEIERRGDPSMLLFVEGKNYVEVSASTVQPSVSGAPRGVPTGPTGNIQEGYQSFAGGYKHQLNEKVALAFVIDEPVGASVNYNRPGAFFSGSNAEVNSIAFTGLAKYQVNDQVSVYGGLRYMGLSGNILVISPATGGSPVAPPAPYTLNVDKDYQFGYLLGAAYEIPSIAMRVALTYESKTEHDFNDNNGTPFEVEIPQPSRYTLNPALPQIRCFSALSNGGNGRNSRSNRPISSSLALPL